VNIKVPVAPHGRLDTGGAACRVTIFDFPVHYYYYYCYAGKKRRSNAVDTLLGTVLVLIKTTIKTAIFSALSAFITK
jgi:hypothetical protein